MQTEGGAPLSGEESAATSLPPEIGPGPAEPGGTGATRLWVVLAVAVVVVTVDQVSKAVVVATMARHAPIRLLGGLLTITYTRNSGAAFSFGTGFTVVFSAVAIAVVVVILRTARRLRSTGWAVALGGLLGGAVGNLVDRIVRAPRFGRGHVVDWIQPPHFAVFNLADASITCSAVGMVALSLLGQDLDGRRQRTRYRARPRWHASAVSRGEEADDD